ncbi:hypothetical protein P4N68_10225 [Corynebacterium felinum]|uniref:Cytoskeletal protein RodZ n=1 Tax=Corynebacterium felinum TaxID=131318 RepID=A0ABU2B5A4_9CORY|nr:hypothetical protein [Corynebacterium felinum]MDF5821448.1 hypothetical protein [Corynebacterium felinum]MDR7353799.1 cytoskeletal protein RodZ [Corynebacterium felinum]WJY95978.1 hypothetical protein CFELI_11985 [Corynebacterium felinum]
MKPLKTVARRGAMITAAAASALILASCSAGQVTQTSSQVAAVDGASADSEDGTVAVRDVTIHVTDKGETGVKFTAINQDNSDATHTLKSVTIDGKPVTIKGETAIKSNCTLVADVPSEMKKLVEPKGACVTHVTTSTENPGFAFGGTKEVVFTFDNATVTTSATISTPVLESGMVDRETGAEKHHH